MKQLLLLLPLVLMMSSCKECDRNKDDSSKSPDMVTRTDYAISQPISSTVAPISDSYGKEVTAIAEAEQEQECLRRSAEALAAARVAVEAAAKKERQCRYAAEDAARVAAEAAEDAAYAAAKEERERERERQYAAEDAARAAAEAAAAEERQRQHEAEDAAAAEWERELLRRLAANPNSNRARGIFVPASINPSSDRLPEDNLAPPPPPNPLSPEPDDDKSGDQFPVSNEETGEDVVIWM
jgi:hypothetical protein